MPRRALPGHIDNGPRCAATRAAGIAAVEAASVQAALAVIVARDPMARVLICGSLYLAGHILRENG